jgi:hypothetical protein
VVTLLATTQPRYVPGMQFSLRDLFCGSAIAAGYAYALSVALRTGIDQTPMPWWLWVLLFAVVLQEPVRHYFSWRRLGEPIIVFRSDDCRFLGTQMAVAYTVMAHVAAWMEAPTPATLAVMIGIWAMTIPFSSQVAIGPSGILWNHHLFQWSFGAYSLTSERRIKLELAADAPRLRPGWGRGPKVPSELLEEVRAILSAKQAERTTDHTDGHG